MPEDADINIDLGKELGGDNEDPGTNNTRLQPDEDGAIEAPSEGGE